MLAPMQRVGAVLATTVILGLAACGDDKPHVNAGRDKVALLPEKASYKLTRAERTFRSCLTEAGIKVVIPRTAYAPLSARIAPDVRGVADSFIWVSERPTDAAKRVARDCAEESKKSSANATRETIDELGTAEPEIQKLGKDQISVGLPGAGPTRFSPKQHAIYELQKTACGAFSPKQTGREYGIESSDPVEIAQQLSKKVARPEFEEAAFEGCLAGFGIK
jgi:hypothetical protein